MHGLLVILIYPHITTWHCLILGLFWVTSQCPSKSTQSSRRDNVVYWKTNGKINIDLPIVLTYISAVSLTATASSTLEVCEPQYTVGFSTSPKTHHKPWTWRVQTWRSLLHPVTCWRAENTRWIWWWLRPLGYHSKREDRKFLKSCVRARAEQGNINHPAYGTWMADFILRQNESRAFLGRYLNDSGGP